MNIRRTVGAAIFACSMAFSLPATFSPAAASAAGPARVFFLSPKDGADVRSPVQVRMGVEGMQVVPAGEVKPSEGHHHIIVDGGSMPEGEVIPSDATHLHFGKGQTDAAVLLPPGQHTLTLQFADGAHRSYGEKLSSTIAVNVLP